MPPVDPFSEKRTQMVADQLVSRGIVDPRVLKAMQTVPRHIFVPARLQNRAYTDRPLPIGVGQTISQPYIVALMVEMLELTGSETVLEVGTGSGYQTAILAQLAAKVISLERIPELAWRAHLALQHQGYTRITIHCQDGSGGYPPEAPYGGILVAACAPAVPPPLLDQLAPGARLVLPVQTDTGQVLQVWQKTAAGTCTCANHLPVAFVPLIGNWGNPS